LTEILYKPNYINQSTCKANTLDINTSSRTENILTTKSVILNFINRYITTTFSFCPTGLFFQSYSRLDQSVIKKKFWKLLQQYVLQAKCLSCRPTNNI